MKEVNGNSTALINSWKLALLVLFLAAIFRLWGTFELNELLQDEGIHVSNAISLGTHGTAGSIWFHPQLSGLIIYGSIKTFGNNSVGWRSSNVVFGTLSVALLFLIARILYSGTATPVIAAALLAFDPYHILLSRHTYTEIPVTFFFLLYLYLILEYTERNRNTLPFAGLAMGITIALKGYFVFAIPLVAIYALYKKWRNHELCGSVIGDFASCLLLLPCAIYFLSYVKWFSRGYYFSEFILMKRDAVWALNKLTLVNLNKAVLEAGGKPWEWFIKPLFWGHQRLLNSTEGMFILHSNNPPFRLLVLPALLLTSCYAVKKRLPRELLAPLLFLSCYMLMLLVQRPMFSISSVVLLPFAFLSVARSVVLCAGKSNREQLIYACFLITTLAWGVYMFPLVSARVVSLATYQPILSLVKYMGNF